MDVTGTEVKPNTLQLSHLWNLTCVTSHLRSFAGVCVARVRTVVHLVRGLLHLVFVSYRVLRHLPVHQVRIHNKK